MYTACTDSGLGFTQHEWMPTPGSLGDTKPELETAAVKFQWQQKT